MSRTTTAPAATTTVDEPGAFFWVALAAPWGIAAAGAIWAGFLRWSVRDDEYVFFWAVAIFTLNVVLVAFAYFASRPRGRLTCLHATASFTLYAAWQMYAVGTPNFTWRPLLVYFLAMVAIGATSNMMTIWHRGSGGSEGAIEIMRRKVGEVRALNAIHTRDGRVIATIEAEPGAVVDKFDVNALGSLVGAPRGGTSIVPIDNSLTKARVIIDPNDRLKVPMLYPGVAAQIEADLCRVPAALGGRASGAPLALYFAGDEDAGRNLAHVLAVGMNGAGKSEFYRYLILDGMARGPAYTYDYANARKADQEPAWVLDGAENVARTKTEVIAYLRWLRDEETPRRAAILGKAGFGQWSTAAYIATGLPFRDVMLDEYSAVGPDIERLATDLGETLRSLGCRLVVGVQRATGGRINTDFRAQFGAVITFGVDNDDSATVALTEAQQDAGCLPQAWKNKHPGKCYLDAPGVSDEEACEPARTFKPNKVRMNQWGEALVARRRDGWAVAGASHEASVELAPPAPVRPAPSEASRYEATAPGEGGDGMYDEEADYAGEEHVGNVSPEAGDEAVAQAAERAFAAAQRAHPDDGDEEAEGVVERVGGEMNPFEAAEMAATDHTKPIEHEPGGMDLRLTPRMSPEEARNTARTMILALRERGFRAFKVEDVGADILEVTGMSAQWLSKWLGEWCEQSDEYGAPILRRTSPRGRYEFVEQRKIDAA